MTRAAPAVSCAHVPGTVPAQLPAAAAALLRQPVPRSLPMLDRARAHAPLWLDQDSCVHGDPACWWVLGGAQPLLDVDELVARGVAASWSVCVENCGAPDLLAALDAGWVCARALADFASYRGDETCPPGLAAGAHRLARRSEHALASSKYELGQVEAGQHLRAVIAATRIAPDEPLDILLVSGDPRPAELLQLGLSDLLAGVHHGHRSLYLVNATLARMLLAPAQDRHRWEQAILPEPLTLARRELLSTTWTDELALTDQLTAVIAATT